MKTLFLIIILFLLTGCGIYKKIVIETKCIDGILLNYYYEASGVDKDENITKPEYLDRTWVVPNIKCYNTQKGI